MRECDYGMSVCVCEVCFSAAGDTTGDTISALGSLIGLTHSLHVRALCLSGWFVGGGGGKGEGAAAGQVG